MPDKPLNIGEEAKVQMPMKTVASLIFVVAAGVFAYTELNCKVGIVRDIKRIISK